jgi:uncharacterized membrane protein
MAITEYLILFVLLAVSLVILFLMARVLLQVKRGEDKADVRVVEVEPSETVAPEAVLEDIEEEEKKEAPQ